MVNSKKTQVSLQGQWLKKSFGTQEAAKMLVKVICEPKKESKKEKAALHLSFALDCSGSMSEPAGATDSPMIGQGIVGNLRNMQALQSMGGVTKMEACKNALKQIVMQLKEQDHASLTLFSSGAQVIFECAPMSAQNKEKLCALVSNVYAGGSTSLLEGWALAAKQCVGILEKNLASRVILLTDGNATTETNIDVISGAVEKIAKSNVSTSCFGVGAHFNEDLLMQMSQKGEGNFRYIPDAIKAQQAIEQELASFDNLLSSKSYLKAWVTDEQGKDHVCTVMGLEEQSVLDKVSIGQLLHGNTLEYVIVAPQLSAQKATLHVQVFWSTKKGVQKSEQNSWELLIVEKKKSNASIDQVVQDALVLQEASLQKKKIAKSIESGNWAQAQAQLGETKVLVSTMMSAGSLSLAQESADLQNLERLVAVKNSALGRKEALYQSYSRSVNQNVRSDDSSKY